MPEENPPAQHHCHVTYHGNRAPSFSGKETEDCKVHWLKFLDYLEDINCTEDKKIDKFKVSLNGDAREWYELNKASFDSLVNLEQLFKAAYQTEPSRSELLKQFHHLKLAPSETLVAYKNRLNKIALKAKITDQEMVTSQFIEGLPDSLKVHVSARRDATLEEVLKTAQAVMAATTVATPPQAMIMAETEKLTTQLDHLHVSRDTYRPSTRQYRPRTPSRSRNGPNDRPYNDRSRRPSRSTSRDRHYSRSDRSSSNGRSSGSWSRDDSRNRRQGRRYPTPGRNNSQSPRRGGKVSFEGMECWYCGGQHEFATCHLLKKALKNGKVRHSENF